MCTGNTSRPHRQATSWHWKYCLTDNVIHEKRVRKSQWPPTALVAVHHHAEGAIFNHCFYVGQFWRIQLICNNKNAHFTLAVGTHNLVKILIENSAKSIHQIQICLKIDLPIQEAFKGILTFLSPIRCFMVDQLEKNFSMCLKATFYHFYHFLPPSCLSNIFSCELYV